MLKNFLIGIPVRNFKNPMSRLENILSVEKRIELSKGMFKNIVKSFEMTTQKLFVSQMMSLLLITVRTMILRHSQPEKRV